MTNSEVPSMEYLPVEVIAHIFRFLPSLEDRKAASLVCRLWYEAYQSPVFRKYEVLEIVSNEGFEELSKLSNPNRIFVNVSTRGVDINKNSQKFWDRFGPYIKTLSISDCDFREKAFVHVMKRCDNLELLSIQDCRELLMSGCLLENESDRIYLQEKLSGLKSLNLGYNRYLSDAIFMRFGFICPNIEELLLPGCYISFHSGLYHKFYSNEHSEPSESVFTFHTISNFIGDHAKNLKSLSFSETLIDSHAVDLIAQTKGLYLRELHLRGCLQVTNDCIMSLPLFQSSLTHLDLSFCPRITDRSLLTICNGLRKLQSLSIQGCRAITDMGVSDLWRLGKLNRLNISECELIHDEGIIKGLCKRKNKTLEELYLSHLGDLSDASIVQMMEFLPNLKVLDLGNCYQAVTDRSIQAIFSNAKSLTTLILTMCEGLTDRGLTGIPLNPTPVVQTEVPKKHVRIPLGSKAELKIIRDAKIKQDVQKICESVGLMSDLSGSSLSNLKHLQKLNLSGCNGISDVSLRYAFKLPELRELDLSCCQQISAEGLSYVCENNRCIECLNLDQCHNVNDDGVLHIFKHLRRLKLLTLGSKQITDRITEGICWQKLTLNYLDVRHCEQLSAVAVTEIMKCHPQLNVVHLRSPPAFSYNDFPYMSNIPPPPPPPPLPPAPLSRF